MSKTFYYINFIRLNIDYVNARFSNYSPTKLFLLDFLKFLAGVRFIFKRARKIDTKNKVNSLYSLGFSKNQNIALKELQTMSEKIKHFDCRTSQSSIYPWNVVYLFSLLFAPLSFIYLSCLLVLKEYRNVLPFCFWECMKCPGYFLGALYFYSRTNITHLVLADDQNPVARALLYVSRYTDVKTIYIQHAGVSNIFPPLDFDFALLDGEYSENVYSGISKVTNTLSKTKVLHFGATRYEKFYEVAKDNIESKINHVIVAINKADNINEVEELCQSLSNYGFYVGIKPHPAMKIPDELKKFRIIDDNNLINCKKSFGIVIAGNSNVLLDAAMLGFLPLYTSKLSEPYDYCGFVKNRVAYDIADIDIRKLLSAKTFNLPSLDEIRFYDACFGMGKNERLSFKTRKLEEILNA